MAQREASKETESFLYHLCTFLALTKVDSFFSSSRIRLSRSRFIALDRLFS